MLAGKQGHKFGDVVANYLELAEYLEKYANIFRVLLKFMIGQIYSIMVFVQ